MVCDNFTTTCELEDTRRKDVADEKQEGDADMDELHLVIESRCAFRQGETRQLIRGRSVIIIQHTTDNNQLMSVICTGAVTVRMF